MIFVGAILFGAILWVIGSILDKQEREAQERENARRIQEYIASIHDKKEPWDRD